MNYKDFISNLEAQLGFPIKNVERSGGFEMRFEEGAVLSFELAEDKRYFDVYTPIAPWPDHFNDEIASFLLESHLLGVATANCYFGIESNHLYLFTRLYLEGVSIEKTKACVQAIMNLRGYWAAEFARLPEMITQGSALPELTAEQAASLYFQRV